MLIFGANGQLGKSFKKVALKTGTFDGCTFLDFPEVDFSDRRSLENVLAESKDDIIINFAAYTAVDKAEEEKELCLNINSFAPEIIAKFATTHGKKLIHISTDYVFGGDSSVPYREDDPVSPCNYYGFSKLAGENNIKKYNPDGVILRTSALVSEFGNNFVKTMVRLLSTKDELRVVTNQITRITYAADLSSVILKLAELPMNGTTTLHFCNKHQMSWFEFADLIKSRINSSCNIIGVDSIPQTAVRPKFSVLDTAKIEDFLNIDIRNIDDTEILQPELLNFKLL